MPPTTSVDRRPVTSAIVAMLAAAHGRPVGDGEAPADTTLPYSVVFEVPGGGFEGPAFAAPDADAAFVYQVTSVGERRDQAGWMADQNRRALLGRDAAGVFVHAIASEDLTAAGLVVDERQPQATGGVDREGRVFNASDRYVVVVRGVA